jgi:hypothetical protein
MTTGFPKNPYENPSLQGISENVPNYLVQSILVTLCCCPPLGLVAIVYAVQVNSMLAVNNVAGARLRSRKAKIWCWIALGCGIALSIYFIIIYFAVARLEVEQQKFLGA